MEARKAPGRGEAPIDILSSAGPLSATGNAVAIGRAAEASCAFRRAFPRSVRRAPGRPGIGVHSKSGMPAPNSGVGDASAGR